MWVLVRSSLVLQMGDNRKPRATVKDTMTLFSRSRVLVAVVALGALALVACDASPTVDTSAAANELRGPVNGPAPGPTVNVARTGIADDTIKPTPTVNVARTGAADDTIKPAPTVNVARTGVPDDTIKPGPKVNIAKVGTADDGVKPGPKVNVAKVGTADDGVKRGPTVPPRPAPTP